MKKQTSKYGGICVLLTLLNGGAFAHSGDRVLYVSDGTNDWAQWDIYARDLDTGSVTQLTNHAAIDNHPDISPDGKWVVWSSTRGNGEFDLFLDDFSNMVAGIDGTLRRLTDDSYPNGPQTAYPDRHPHFHTGDPHIILFSSKNRPLAYPIEIVSECSSPIIIVPPRFYEGLNVIRLDTNGNVATYVELDIRDAWDSATHPDIWTNNTSTYVGHATFNHAGDTILFSGSIDGQGTVWEVYTAGFDTNALALIPNSLRRRTHGPVVGSNPIQMSGGSHFSHDDLRIYYSSTRTPAGNSQIFSIPATGIDVPVTSATQETSHPGNDYIPEPLPDGGVLVVSDLGSPGLCGQTNGPTLDLDLWEVSPTGVRTNLTDNDAATETLLLGDEVSWFCGLPPNGSACRSVPRIFALEALWLMMTAYDHTRGFAPSTPIPPDLLSRFGYPDQAVRMYAEAWRNMHDLMSIQHAAWFYVLVQLQQMMSPSFYPPFPGLEDEILLREWLDATAGIRTTKVVAASVMYDRGLGASWFPWVTRWSSADDGPFTGDPSYWDMGVPGSNDIARFDGSIFEYPSIDTVVTRLLNDTTTRVDTIGIELIALHLTSVDPIAVQPTLSISNKLDIGPGVDLTVSNLTVNTEIVSMALTGSPSTGLPSSAFIVDSFFDVAYRVEFSGISNVFGIGTGATVRVPEIDIGLSGGSGNVFRVESGGSLSVTNPASNGRLQVYGGNRLHVDGEVKTDTLGVGGVMKIGSQGTVFVGQGAQVQATGEWSGDGRLTLGPGAGSLEVEGRVSPGESPGILTIEGGLAMSNSAVLNIEIGGPTVGTGYDRLVVTGHADLDGTLSVVLTNGFAPSSGDAFDVLTYGTHSNGFAVLDLPPLAPDLLWHTVYGVTSVTLHALARSGDFDSDGIPNGWEQDRFGSVTNANPAAMASNGVNTLLEAYIADLDPHDPASGFGIVDVGAPYLTLKLDLTSTGRVYDVDWSTNLLQAPPSWSPYGFDLFGTGSNLLFFITNDTPFRVYRSRVRLP